MNSPLGRMLTRAVRRARADRWHVLPGQVEPEIGLTWTGLPRHAADRVAVAVAARRHREPRPWLTPAALREVEQALRPTDHVLELGSGSSTLWFARHAARVTSVEASPAWYAAVAAQLREHGHDHVDLVLADVLALGRDTDAHVAAYLAPARALPDASQHLVLVDGEYRDRCALEALRLVAPGGRIVVDNVEMYLPTGSRSPWRVPRPATEGWAEFADRVADWESHWTSNGVWDTAIWVRPGDVG